MPAGERLVFEAMAFGGIDLGIAPERRDDRPQARHAVKEREYRPRRGQTASELQTCALHGGRRSPACSVSISSLRRPPRLARREAFQQLGHGFRNPRIDPRLRVSVMPPHRFASSTLRSASVRTAERVRDFGAALFRRDAAPSGSDRGAARDREDGEGLTFSSTWFRNSAASRANLHMSSACPCRRSCADRQCRRQNPQAVTNRSTVRNRQPYI